MDGKGHQTAVPGGVDVVTMPAEAGYAEVNQVSAAVIAALACGTATVVADFTGTQFCDPAGIGELLTAPRLVDANHITLRLAAPDAVAQIIGLAGVDRCCRSTPPSAKRWPPARHRGQAKAAKRARLASCADPSGADLPQHTAILGRRGL